MLKQCLLLVIALIASYLIATTLQWDYFYNVINKLEITLLFTVVFISLTALLLDLYRY